MEIFQYSNIDNMPTEMLESDNSVLETEIAKLLNRSNAKIPLKAMTVNVRELGQGRHGCRIQISGGTGNNGVKADFEDVFGEGFFLRAEKSLALQLEPGPVTGNAVFTP